METRTVAGAGKRIFILNPSGEAIEKIVLHLAQEEIEAYAVELPLNGFGFLDGFPGSLVFLDYPGTAFTPGTAIPDRVLDSLSDKEWGLLLENERDAESEEIVPDGRAIPLGILPFGSDPEGTVRSLDALLEARSVRGQRQYVRFGSNDMEIAAMTATYKGNQYRGIVHDISSAGISCSLSDKSAVIPINGVLDPLEIRFADWSISIPGSVGIRRSMAGETILVLMFDQAAIRKRSADIREFVHRSLQNQFNAKVASYLRTIGSA